MKYKPLKWSKSKTQLSKQTYYFATFRFDIIRNAHILYLMPLYIGGVERGGVYGCTRFSRVEWGVSAWLLRVKEREQAKEHDLLYMGGVGGSVRGSGGDRPSYIFTHPCWDLESELGGWCNGCSKHNPKQFQSQNPNVGQFDNCSQVMSSKTMENYRIAIQRVWLAVAPISGICASSRNPFHF